MSNRTSKRSKGGVAGRWLLAIALVIFGAQHSMYAAFVATLIPAWIPGHLFFTYLTGAGMVAAGISITTKVYARLAGVLLGSMFLFWVVFLHAPRVMAQIHNGDEWTSAFIALAMNAGAFVVAGHASHHAGEAAKSPIEHNGKASTAKA